MFSRLTNQISSWLGSKCEQEEEVSTSIAVLNPENKRDTSLTNHNKLDVSPNVKNQTDGIPKFSKDPASEDCIEELPVEQQKDNDDKDEQFEAVETKSFESYLYSAFNKMSEAGAKFTQTIKENNILDDFTKQQASFLKHKASNIPDAAVPPWTGSANEDAMKEACLSLSSDSRNFLKSPPAGVDFHFDYDVSYPVAIATMTEDSSLQKMRFELVPKKITEENFWRNYFYRVSLIYQANELSYEYMSRERESQLVADTGNSEDQLLEEDMKNESSSGFISDIFQTNSFDVEDVNES